MKGMGSFQDITANLMVDPTRQTMRSILYHQVGPNCFFTRSGEMFYFGPTDTKQEDRFIKNFPHCMEDSLVGRRRWFGHVTTHGTQHGIYIHDLFCFRTLTFTTQLQQLEYQGFTCDSEKDTEQFDLPEQVSIQLTRWSGNSKAGTHIKGYSQ